MNQNIDMTEHNIRVLEDLSAQFPTIEWKFNKLSPNPKAVSIGYNFIIRFKHDILGMMKCELFSTSTEFRDTMTLEDMYLTFNNMTYRPSNIALALQGVGDIGAFLEK